MVASAGRGPRDHIGRDLAISILDLADNVASVKVLSEPFVDYLHLARLDGRWSIVNVLYEDREPEPSTGGGGLAPEGSERAVQTRMP
jgi:putative lumazine-binding protein